jgi:cytoskeletal protein RodZ
VDVCLFEGVNKVSVMFFCLDNMKQTTKHRKPKKKASKSRSNQQLSFKVQSKPIPWKQRLLIYQRSILAIIVSIIAVISLLVCEFIKQHLNS